MGDASSFRSRNWNRPKIQSRTIESAGPHNRHKGRSDSPSNGFYDLAMYGAIQSSGDGSSPARKIESYSLPQGKDVKIKGFSLDSSTSSVSSEQPKRDKKP